MDSFEGSDVDSTDSLHGSEVDQFHGSTKPGPIRMGVADWLNILGDEDAEEKETTENPGMILMLIKSKASAVEQMKEQLAALTGGQEIDSELEEKVKDTEKAVEQGEADLQQAWTQSTLSLAKTYTEAAAPDDIEQAKKELLEDIKSRRSVDDEEAASLMDQVVDQMKEVHKKQEDLARARKALELAQGAPAQTTAIDADTQQAMLRDSIESATVEIDELNARYNATKVLQQ